MGSRQDRARTQSSIPSHTLLTGPIYGGFGRCSEPPRRAGGHDVERRAVVLSARKYILHIHTRPTVAWRPPPGAYRARAGSRTGFVYAAYTWSGKGLTFFLSRTALGVHTPPRSLSTVPASWRRRLRAPPRLGMVTGISTPTRVNNTSSRERARVTI